MDTERNETGNYYNEQVIEIPCVFDAALLHILGINSRIRSQIIPVFPCIYFINTFHAKHDLFRLKAVALMVWI
jgi:hypothetical protein